tara:strand:- start:147 stop:773 length:627 start_codon:yes stop_codon:yes gene_type:complete
MGILNNSGNSLPSSIAFENPINESQNTFRHILKAMSEPGVIRNPESKLSVPSPLYLATAAVGLTLLDFQTQVWVDIPHDHDVIKYLKFHTGMKLTENPYEADFALVFSIPRQLDSFNLGSDSYPDASATLIIQTKTISTNGNLILTGPGIKSSRNLGLPEIPSAFWSQRVELQKLFPRGLDLIFTTNHKLVAIPRTTIIKQLKTNMAR